MNNPISSYKAILAFVLILITTITFSQDQSNELQLAKFVVKTGVSNQVIPFSFVANMRTGDGKETREDGCFNMYVAAGDSLIFKCLGYIDTTWVVSNENLLLDTIPLNVEKKSYSLNEVNVYWFRSYAAFKQMFLSLKVPSGGPMKMNFNINVKEINALAKANSGTFGISSSMGGRTWKSKEQRKFDVFLANEKRYERLRELTSHKNMLSFTGFEGEKLDSFVVFLRRNYKINPDLSDYKIMVAVQVAYEEFLAMQ